MKTWQVGVAAKIGGYENLAARAGVFIWKNSPKTVFRI